MNSKEVASLVGDWGFDVSGSAGSSLGALWELSGSSSQLLIFYFNEACGRLKYLHTPLFLF